MMGINPNRTSEIVVTQAMIAAGADRYDWLAGEASSAYLVEEVYRAMENARNQSADSALPLVEMTKPVR